MGNSSCPACGRALTADGINLKEGVALCAACGTLSRLADVVGVEPTQHLLADPPEGCVVRESGAEIVVTAPSRSRGLGAALLVFAVLWNLIVLVFVVLTLGEHFRQPVGPLPSSFPSPGSNGRSSGGSMFGSGNGAGSILFMGVFLTPFVLIGSGVAVFAIAMLVGRAEVVLRRERGLVRIGFGKLWWKQRFDASRVRSVKEGLSTWTQNGQAVPQVHIEADRTVKFGSMLTTRGRAWMIATLRSLLLVNPSKG